MMVTTKHITLLGCALSLLLGRGVGEGESLSSLPDPDYSDELPPYICPFMEKIRYLIYPVLGCPALVVAGGSLTAIVSLEDGGITRDWTMTLSTHDKVSQTYTLTDVTCDYDAVSDNYAVTGIVPPQVPREVFDLLMRSEGKGIADSQPNAVRVITEIKEDYRFVHVTDMHGGDPRSVFMGPADENNGAHPFGISEQILAEISFLDPEFIIFTGDLVFGGPYLLEYSWAWEMLSIYSQPMFMVPGNHDGYAGGGGVLRDGLAYWKQVIGIPYYSFNYGDKLHVSCVNTYDGDVSQRDGFYFFVQKWGGRLSEAQLAWLEKDLEEASQEGRTSIILSHHDPRGNIHRFGGENNPADEDNDGYAEATDYHDMLFFQEWNDKQSGERMVRIIRERNALSLRAPPSGVITHIFLGHVHSDFIDLDEESATWWVHTTAAGSDRNSGDDFWGYRVVEIKGNQIAKVNQTAPEGEELPPGDNDPTNNQKWDYQSYPGNSIVIDTTLGRNDGASSLVVQEVTNYLATSVSGILKFYVPLVVGEGSLENNYGYQVSGGIIRQVARSGDNGNGNTLIFYVETMVDAGETVNVTLEHSGSVLQDAWCSG